MNEAVELLALEAVHLFSMLSSKTLLESVNDVPLFGDEAASEGRSVLVRLTREAVLRRLRSGEPSDRLFTPEELQELADALGVVLADARTQGRIRILSDALTAITRSVDAPPTQAVGFLRGLELALGADPQRVPLTLQRQAFTLAVATETELLDRVRGAIADRLESGRVITGPAAVRDILDQVGVSTFNPQYAEMVFRTNAIDSYNQAAQDQMAASQDMFPVWKYSNPGDSRSRPRHAALSGKFFLSHIPFTAVRGTEPDDVCNCRCTFIPVDKFTWERLQNQGAKVESQIPV